MRDAAIALCQAKAQGRNCHVRFEPAMKTAAMERLELETDLREALQENQFFLVYQPVFELDSVGVWGVEAFLRWRHPVRGIVEPDYFGPVLEETELDMPVGLVGTAPGLPSGGGLASPRSRPHMSINVSVRELEADGFVDQVEDMLSAAALEPASLVVDVAETSSRSQMPTG